MFWIACRRGGTAALLFVMALPGAAIASDYAHCLFDRLGQSSNDASTNAAVALCLKAHPGGFASSKIGDGQGIFFKTDPDQCTLNQTRGTSNQRAAYLIASACRHLYGEPPKGPAPAINSFDVFDGKPEPVPAPKPSAKPVSLAPAAAYKPRLQETREQRKAQADLNEAAKRITADYPFLDTPQGAEALEKIIARRDELIESGVYPALALQRAANAIAPAYAASLK